MPSPVFRSRPTRRALLAAAAGVAAAAAGCTPPARLTVPPEANAVFGSALQLRARYDAVADAWGDAPEALAQLREEHDRHVEVLARLLGPPADGSDVESPELDAESEALLQELIDAEADGEALAADSCVDAAPEFVVVLGEIAACRASHVDALEALK